MNEIFDFCVRLLVTLSDMLGMTYEQINVWLFVIIHPLITLFFIIMFLRSRKYKKMYFEIIEKA